MILVLSIAVTQAILVAQSLYHVKELAIASLIIQFEVCLLVLFFAHSRSVFAMTFTWWCFIENQIGIYTIFLISIGIVGLCSILAMFAIDRTLTKRKTKEEL